MRKISGKTVGRLSVYRRVLVEALARGEQYLHSHELAVRAGATAAQVRRDLMVVGCSGNPKRGYEIAKLHEGLARFLAESTQQNGILIGVGNLGRALLSYFSGGRSNLVISAAFDSDPAKGGRVFHGCRCYSMEELPHIIDEKKIKFAIITVPAEAAQHTAEKLVACNVKGILNFAPLPLRVPPGVYVENVDVTMYLEKVAFFGRHKRK